MSSSHSQPPSKDKDVTKAARILLFLGIFLVYLIVRLIAWKNTVLVEDHDSITYLNNIKSFLSFDLQAIINLSPDMTPFYPFFAALCSLPGWSVETGARLCSMLFSSMLFLAVIGIGNKIAKSAEVALGLLILTFSPALISLSFSILTEPSYIATVYLGLWLFWTQYENPRISKAALLGIIFGLSFLNRTEGILYLGVIPFFQAAHFSVAKGRNYSFKPLLKWTIAFVVCFSLVAIPQIWSVSRKMGHLAINGRQVWMLIWRNPDGKSPQEKIYGLDFSSSQINLEYIQSHPHVVKELTSNISPVRYFKTVFWNINDLYQNKLGILIGPLGAIFFAFGLLALYQAGRGFDSFLVLGFIVFSLVAPFMADVWIRHIAIIAPLLMLVGGIGIVHLSEALSHTAEAGRLRKWKLSLVFLSILVVLWAGPLGDVFSPRYFNSEYSPRDLEEPVRIVKGIARDELLEHPRILARKGYLAYFAEGTGVSMPYTNYDGLVKYCQLNDVDFVFLQHRLLGRYPFLEAFLKGSPPAEFLLVYTRLDSFGRKIALYRFRKKIT